MVRAFYFIWSTSFLSFTLPYQTLFLDCTKQLVKETSEWVRERKRVEQESKLKIETFLKFNHKP